MNERTVIDRTTRFLVTLTLFGGAWYVLKGVTNLWVNTFSEIFYSKSIINSEHIFSMSLLIIIVAITGTVITYLYREYETYRYYEDIEEMKAAIEKADKSFDGIFSMIKVSILSFLMINLLPIFVKEIKILTFLLMALTGILIGVIYLFYLKEKVKDLISNYTPIKFNSKGKQFSIIIYISFLILILSLSVMVVSFESNQKVEVKIEETSKIPIEISLKNFENPVIEFSIYREKKPKENVMFKLKKDDLQSSLVEVYETNIPNENFVLKSNIENKFPRSKNENSFIYTSELSKYILEGENAVEIIILSESSTNKKTVRIVTTIYKDGKDVKVHQKNYKVNP